MKNCITCSFRSSEPEKYYKKYMKKMHMICKMEEKRVKYMCLEQMMYCKERKR